MAEVTVKQLAEDVGAPVDRLLRQFEEAGLSKRAEDDVVTDEEKQTLLAFLRRSQSGEGGGPSKVTLKRRTTTQLKTGGGAGRGKTVNVEVRKKRTYVKRTENQPQTAAAGGPSSRKKPGRLKRLRSARLLKQQLPRQNRSRLRKKHR